MNVSAHRAFSLLRELAYERVSGSKEERKAAEHLLAVAREIGVDAHIEEFKVPCGMVDHARLVVTAPYEKEYTVTGYERAQNTPEEGIDGEFYYAEDVLPAHLKHVKDKIVLINGMLRRGTYKKLKEAGAKAILTYSGAILDRESESDCAICKLRETLTEPFGTAVALNMRAADAAEIVRRGAKQMHIELEGESYEGTSQNVCAVIKGTTYPDEIISLGAHYDTVYFAEGVYDNMSGSVILMELLRYFAEHKPARTLKFNWYGSEEQGLLGSKAWTAAHEEELGQHVLMINVDLAATTLGRNVVPVLATDAVVGYVDGLMLEAGVPCDVKLDIYSSDCMPFADKGVPAVNFARFGAKGADYGHDRRDCLKTGYVDENALGITLNQALFFAKRVANAADFPIERTICDEIKDKIDKYLFKKE